jgi:phage terminase large subunit GpA-like protein
MVAATLALNSLYAELSGHVAHARTPRVRTMRQYTEDELIIPEGQYKDERFRLYRQPFVGLLLDAIDSGLWNQIAVTGCVQGGKSLFGFVNPAAYHLFECKDNVILGVPNTNVIGRDKWNNEIKPTIEAGRYADMMPTKGVGSQGGWGNEVAFLHGPKLKFMTGTGGDENRSSYTARVVIITEADKMDTAGEVSREADPVTQLTARSASWDRSDRRLYMECTVSHTQGRIWQEYINGTASRIACPCPYCREYVTPERDSIRGWHDAIDEIDAEEKAYFVCPACEHKLTEDDRREMNRLAVLVHRGQEIDKEGTITGDLPRTRTLGFRWNAWNNMFWSTATIGADEWRANHSEDEDSAEKERRQFAWATPWDPPAVELAPIDPRKARVRYGPSRQGFVPEGTTALTMGVDIGKWVSWWHLTAWNATGGPHVVDHGEFAVPSSSMDVELAILTALKTFRDETVLEGWPLPDGELYLPEQVWIDSRYKPDAVLAFCRESGERFRPIQGLGYGQHYHRNYTQPKKAGGMIKQVGNGYHFVWRPDFGVFVVEINADQWKGFWHERLVTPMGQPGAATLYHSTKESEHRDLIRHYTAEKQVKEFIPDLGTVFVWKRIRAKNHKLDGAYIASAAADFCGVRVVKIAIEPRKPPEESKPFLTPNGEPYLITERNSV